MRTQYNYVSESSDFEHADSDCSLVVPNCSLSVRQILERFRRTGIPEDLYNRGFFDDSDDDIDTPVTEFTDLTDLSDMSQNLEQVVNRIKYNTGKE